MNVFQLSSEIKAQADSKRNASGIPSPEKIKLPYFQGNMKKKGELTASFLMSYFTCYASCIVLAENAEIRKRNKAIDDKEKHEQPVSLSIYLVEAVMNHEGFSLHDYKQSGRQGHKAIAYHLKAIAEARATLKNLQVTEEGEIKGLLKKQVQDVLSAI